MKKALFLPIMIFLFSCGGSGNDQGQGVPSPDNAFAILKENFINDLWKMYPTWASSQGYHEYDHILLPYDEAFRVKEAEFVKSWQEKLN